MRSTATRVVVASVAVLLACVSGAGASVSRSSLALMPLPKVDLGATAIALPLDQDSGVQTNADAARNANGHVTAARLAALGRVTGYALDYNDAAGVALAARHGLLEVETGVELYKSRSAAANGLAFWRRDTLDVSKLRAVGGKVSISTYHAGGLPGGTFAAHAVVRIGGKPPIYADIVAFLDGPLLATASVTAADATSRRAYTVGLAQKLAGRIRDVLAGRVKGPPVPLPAKSKAGPPPNGPELSRLTLGPADLGLAKVVSQGYRLDRDLSPISEYERTMSPAGPFLYLQEEVALFHSPTEASFGFTIMAATLSSPNALQAFGGGGKITSYRPTQIPVQGGDEVRAVRAEVGVGTGKTVIEAAVVMRIGATLEFVIVASPATIPISSTAIRQLAAKTAARADKGLR